MTLFFWGLALLIVAAVAAVALRERRIGGAVFGALVLSGSVVAILPALQVLRTGVARTTTFASGLPGGAWTFGIDPLSAIFLLAILGVGAAAAVYGIGYMRIDVHVPAAPSHAIFALELATLVLVVCAQGVMPFLCAWELMAIGSFLLILTEHHSAEVRRAGLIYIVATHTGTLALFAMFAVLGQASGDWSFAALSSGAAHLGGARHAVLLLGLAGFGVKAGLVPFHFWLPPAHAAAPSHVSALMSGVVIKIGIYGLLRVTMLVGAPPAWWGWTMLGIGLLSAVLGVLWALAQHDIKRLLAYHSVENVGIIAMGIGVGALGSAYDHPALTVIGYAGALLHTINHAVFKSLLFFGAGAVARVTGTRNMEELGGLARRMPLTWATFVVGAAAIVGLPPLNGFVSEWLVYQGLFRAGLTGESVRLAVLAVPGLALVGGLALACFAKVAGVVFLGSPRSDRTHNASEPSMTLGAPAVALAAVCVLIGCAPAIVVPWMMSGGGFVGGRALTPEAASVLAQQVGTRQISIVALVLLVVAALAWIGLRLLRSRAQVRVADTWGCGYGQSSPRMQYTASSFAAPLLDVFGALSGVRSHRGATVFHSEPVDLVLDRAVTPSWSLIRRTALRLRPIQQGRLHRYLGFVIATLVLLLAYLVAGRGAGT